MISAASVSSQPKHPIKGKDHNYDGTPVVVVSPSPRVFVYAPEPDPWTKVTGIVSLFVSLLAVVLSAYVYLGGREQMHNDKRAAYFKRLVIDHSETILGALRERCEFFARETYNNYTHNGLSAGVNDACDEITELIYTAQNAISARIDQHGCRELQKVCDSSICDIQDALLPWLLDATQNRNVTSSVFNHELTGVLAKIDQASVVLLSALADHEFSLFRGEHDREKKLKKHAATFLKRIFSKTPNPQ